MNNISLNLAVSRKSAADVSKCSSLRFQSHYFPECARWVTRSAPSVVELIAATTTKTGLRVESALDTRSYVKGIKVADAQMEALNIEGDAVHPEWNYTIRPRSILANRST